MSAKKPSFLIPVIGTAVIIAGGIAAYMYLKGGTNSSSPLGSAKLVPATALMATYIDTNPESWNKLQQFGTPEARKLLGKEFQNFNQQMLNDSKISYEADIKPWVGGMMIAVLPPDAKKVSQDNFRASEAPNYLLVVGIKDKIAALKFANKLKDKKNVKIQESDYKGQKIIESTGQGQPTYVTVVNNDYLLLTSNKQAVEKAIDTYKGEPSFVTKEGANDILSKGVDVKNGLAQIYVPDYANMIQQLTAFNPQSKQLPPQTLAQIKQVKSLTAGVGIDDDGLRLKAIVNLDPQLNKFQYQATPAKIVGQFPSETLALTSGQGISKSWETFVEQSKDYPELNQGIQQARTQLKALQIDLDKDIFGWMNGEFGLGAIQSNQGLLANVGFGGALVLDTSDRKTAEATFTKLDNLAKQQSLNVAQRNIGGKNVTEWQIPQQGALVAHGWLNDNTAFVAIGGPVAETLANRKGAALDQSDTFKTVTGSLQKPNGGYFYLDMDKTKTIIQRVSAQSQPLPADATAILDSIRGVGVTVNSPSKSMTQMEMLLSLKSGKGK
ncbi:MAG: DUF3352 domain-containing protein [Dolichospermum sp. DEX189]|uniref:DUF3352 domain-containing protein n=1 Tax=Aphanizomenon flos-aquae FACHB-1040 TaxID=2692887 RepID=A0ABR8C1T7_APHFL|nr:DUF3352 domain-containing protein [Aphanizomenon flos-aquae]MBD2280725.1 DUF3352 domain-containing protein [Aphanizomenon flos-aquae FACHB-1040]MBE9256599.1 DUF3352 domain-containing protein [Dolichospermum sp. LEGE 00246]MBO1068444.1 DUF3352 domain-containing protein [Dolichospermum sp. DEX189]